MYQRPQPIDKLQRRQPRPAFEDNLDIHAFRETLPSFSRCVAFSELLRQEDGNSSLGCFAVCDKVRTDAANLLLEHSFDLPDLFLNFAGVFFGVAFDL